MFRPFVYSAIRKLAFPGFGGVTGGGKETLRAWQGDNLGLALRAAGASRTCRRAFPAANGSSGTSGALESLDGNPYPPIHA
jgi:hypothetical protein